MLFNDLKQNKNQSVHENLNRFSCMIIIIVFVLSSLFVLSLIPCAKVTSWVPHVDLAQLPFEASLTFALHSLCTFPCLPPTSLPTASPSAFLASLPLLVLQCSCPSGLCSWAWPLTLHSPWTISTIPGQQKPAVSQAPDKYIRLPSGCFLLAYPTHRSVQLSITKIISTVFPPPSNLLLPLGFGRAVTQGATWKLTLTLPFSLSLTIQSITNCQLL